MQKIKRISKFISNYSNAILALIFIIYAIMQFIYKRSYIELNITFLYALFCMSMFYTEVSYKYCLRRCNEEIYEDYIKNVVNMIETVSSHVNIVSDMEQKTNDMLYREIDSLKQEIEELKKEIKNV